MGQAGRASLPNFHTPAVEPGVGARRGRPLTARVRRSIMIKCPNEVRNRYTEQNPVLRARVQVLCRGRGDPRGAVLLTTVAAA